MAVVEPRASFSIPAIHAKFGCKQATFHIPIFYYRLQDRFSTKGTCVTLDNVWRIVLTGLTSPEQTGGLKSLTQATWNPSLVNCQAMTCLRQELE